MGIVKNGNSKPIGVLFPGLQETTIWDHMGVSEKSVPLNPMVNDHYPY